jgi:ABC-2 type transport system permease protein
MRVYLEIARRAFQMQLAYRTANLAGLTTNSFWGALRSFLFIGLYAGGGAQAGWTQQDAVTYVWLTQAMIMPIYFWAWWEIALTIRSGDVVTDLAKPVDYYAQWLSRDAGRAAYHLLFRFAPTLLVGVLLFAVPLPVDPARWLAFAASLALAIWLSFGLRFLYNLAAFWLLDYRGVGGLIATIVAFLSGFLVPLNYFPDELRQAVSWLPFAGMVQVPVEILLGQRLGADLAGGLLFQALWAVAFLALGRLALTAAERKVIVQGG